MTIEGIKNFVSVGNDPTVVDRNLFFATGTPTGGTYAWSATGSGLSFNNASASQVTITSTSASGALLDKSITVNYTKNGQSAMPPATRAVTARIFRFLQQFSKNRVANDPDKPFGYRFVVTYNVFTNPGGQFVAPGASGISALETVNFTRNDFGVPPTTGAGATDANSQVADVLALESSTPLPPNGLTIGSQDITVGGFFVRNNTLTYSATDVLITNNGPNN